MKYKKITFIINPSAGMGVAGKEWPSIEKLAREKLGPFDAFMTKGPGDATELTGHALTGGSELIVCIGGDGTFNEVINGYMDGDAPVRCGSFLSYVPKGTGLDLSKSIMFPKQPEKALDLIKHAAEPCRVDLGRIRYTNHSGACSLRYFHNIASFGLGGEVVGRVNRSRKALGGFLTFIWATLISLLTYQSQRIRINIDDKTDVDVKCLHGAVANGQFQGGGMWVAPHARVDDGILNTTIIGDLSVMEVLLNLPKLYNGKILTVKKVASFSGKKVAARSDQQVLIDVDGEQLGRLPVTIDIIPGILPLVGQMEPL